MKAETQIQISPEIEYIDFDSDPKAGRYVFTYTITIVNQGPVGARLLSRHWIITDATDKVQEVRGKGVVGEQPHLRPGESFEYTSGTRLRTPTGTMHGRYFCVAVDGEKFDVDIPMFVLDALSDTGSRKHMH